jgi:PAS domain S-box-containing protein
MEIPTHPHDSEGEERNLVNARLLEALSSMNEVVWVRSLPDMTITYINKACEKIYGHKPEEYLGTCGALYENIHPDDHEKMRQGIERALQEGRGQIEYRIFDKQGRIRYISSEGTVIKDADGVPRSVNGISRDVTDLRLIENDLREKIEEVENIFESITDNFIALDKDFKFTHANSEALKLYGLKKEALLGRNIWDLFPNGRKLSFYGQLKKALDEQITVRFEEFSPAIGRWVLVNAYPTKNGLAIYFRDITEQKELQNALRESEHNLRALINNTSDFIWSVDRDLRIIQVNQPFADFVYSFTNKILRTGDSILMDDFGPEMRDKWEGYFKRALSGQTFLVVDEERIGNTKHHREKRFKPIFSEAGEVLGVSVFARDISEETKLNDRIINEEKKLRAIINNTRDIIWLVDDDMETISANQAYYDRVVYLTEYRKHYSELTTDDFAREQVEKWHAYYRRALAGETFSVVEEDEVHGSKVYEEIRFNPIHDKDNNVISVNCLSRDITSEKEHMIRIQEQNEKLNEIAWIQSHQVRGPVATILGLAQLLDPSNSSDPANAKVLEGVKEAAAELDAIIKDVVAKTNEAKL